MSRILKQPGSGRVSKFSGVPERPGFGLRAKCFPPAAALKDRAEKETKKQPKIYLSY
jgi:hypothetical protein